MAFVDNQGELLQEHFTVVEIDLPAFSSGQTCTLPIEGGTGFFTPLTCDEDWDTTTFKTYRFATTNLPRTYGRPPTSSGLPGDIIELDGAAVYPIIVPGGINEEVTELQPGEGLAIQGSASVTFVDVDADPGPVEETTAGTFFGKLAARNILNNKDARIIQYHVNSDGIYAEDDGLKRFYIVDTIKNNGKGTWTITFKDELSKLDKDKNQFPIPTNGSIRVAVNNSTQVIPVDSTIDWSTDAEGNIPYTVKVGDELMKVASVTDNQGPAAALNVGVRGADIVFTNTLSTTIADAHAVGDAVQICHTSDDERIDDFLEIVLESSGIPSAFIPNVDWAAEIDEWHPNDKINTIWHEPVETNDVVKQVTIGFLLDIWYDNEDQEVKLSAISVWQTSGPTIEEGKQITYNTFRINPRELKRFSRAFVYFDKPNKVDNDDIKNYRGLSVNIDSTLEDPGLFGEPKTKEFDNSHVIGSNAADLLTQRTVARFGNTPEEYTFETEEKFLNYNTGDIVDVITPEKQNILGLPDDIRAQILSIKPVYTESGRRYITKALTFESAFADGTEFTITADTENLNIHTFVGAPSQAVNVTLVIDGATLGSPFTGINNPGIVAGNFAFGSKITIILENNAILQSKGGGGGSGGFSQFILTLTNGVGFQGAAGGIVYFANGVDTDIHLGGSILGHTALGTLRAPGGGGGGEDGQGTGTTPIGGDGGGGGAGDQVGNGGSGGESIEGTGSSPGADGVDGAQGDTAGNGGAAGGAGAGAGGDWGVDGAAGDAAGGAAGKGILKGGAVINILTDGNTGRFTNGGGDIPDILS